MMMMMLATTDASTATTKDDDEDNVRIMMRHGLVAISVLMIGVDDRC